MNSLESSVYSYRDALSSNLSSFLTESDKEQLSAMLTATEDWLYDEGTSSLHPSCSSSIQRSAKGVPKRARVLR